MAWAGRYSLGFGVLCHYTTVSNIPAISLRPATEKEGPLPERLLRKNREGAQYLLDGGGKNSISCEKNWIFLATGGMVRQGCVLRWEAAWQKM